jgi:probable rRNA maturation factor
MTEAGARGGRKGAGRRVLQPAGIRVCVTGVDGRPVARAAGLERWLETAAPAGARGLVVVALVSDGRVRTLNRTYRGIDRSTDVLSFPVSTDVPLSSRSAIEGPLLGDVVIATGVARRQAARVGHAYRDELRTLALHGLLHLLGYDHERDQGQMRTLERRLRIKGGLESGLIERATAAPSSRRRSRARTGRGRHGASAKSSL